MSMCDKREQIRKDAYGTLGEKKKEYKVYVLCEYHSVKRVCERTEKHVAGSQSKSPETCLLRLSGPSAWGQRAGAAGRSCHPQDLPCTDLSARRCYPFSAPRANSFPATHAQFYPLISPFLSSLISRHPVR